MATRFTYDFNHPTVDIQENFIDLIVDEPTLLSRFGIIPKTTNGRIHKWFQRQLSPASTTITGFDTDGDGTGVNVASTTGMTALDTLYFESSTGEYRSENVRITTVDSSTDLTIVRDINSSPGATLVIGDIVHLSKTTAEDASVSTQDIDQQTEKTNYTKTYDRGFALTTLGNITPVEGRVNGAEAAKIIDALVQLQREIFWEETKDFIWLYKDQASNTTTDKGALGGFKQFQASGNINSTGGAVSLDHFNDANELIFNDGAGANASRIAVMNVNQARRISAFPTSGTNPLTTRPERDTSTGQWITQIIGDIPGNINEIVIEPNMPKDEIWLINPSLIKMVINLPMQDTDATNNSQRPLRFVRRLTTDITWEIRDAKLAHATITGLTV